MSLEPRRRYGLRILGFLLVFGLLLGLMAVAHRKDRPPVSRGNPQAASTDPQSAASDEVERSEFAQVPEGSSFPVTMPIASLGAGRFACRDRLAAAYFSDDGLALRLGDAAGWVV